jgi:hypothetical protein
MGIKQGQGVLNFDLQLYICHTTFHESQLAVSEIEHTHIKYVYFASILLYSQGWGSIVVKTLCY